MNTRTLIIVTLTAFAAPAMATTFVAQYAGSPSPGPAAPGGAPAPTTPPGLYVQVIDGLINVNNRGGAQQFTTGQFGYTASAVAAPVIVPKNPGLQFTLPPTFSASTPPNGSIPGKSFSVDCEVR